MPGSSCAEPHTGTAAEDAVRAAPAACANPGPVQTAQHAATPDTANVTTKLRLMSPTRQSDAPLLLKVFAHHSRCWVYRHLWISSACPCPRCRQPSMPLQGS